VIRGITLARTPAPPLYTYPARPLNGGPLERARPQPGVWAAEPKWNGWRALVHVPSGTLWNRHGKPLTIAPEFESALEILRATLEAEAFKWVDCEALERRHGIGRGTLIVLDVIPAPGAYRDHTPPSYAERRAWLTPLPVPTLTEVKSHTVYLTPSTFDASRPTLPPFPRPDICWGQCRAANAQLGAPLYEGVVMKRVDSLYPIQLRSAEETTPAWVKHRWRF